VVALLVVETTARRNSDDGAELLVPRPMVVVVAAFLPWWIVRVLVPTAVEDLLPVKEQPARRSTPSAVVAEHEERNIVPAEKDI